MGNLKEDTDNEAGDPVTPRDCTACCRLGVSEERESTNATRSSSNKSFARSVQSSRKGTG